MICTILMAERKRTSKAIQGSLSLCLDVAYVACILLAEAGHVAQGQLWSGEVDSSHRAALPGLLAMSGDMKCSCREGRK